MAFEMLSPQIKGKPSQNLIKISEIRDGVIVLTDGTMRAIMMVSSVNFALKSENEQNAIVYAYQDFINALDFPIQISISSRKMDITAYIEQVKVLKEKQQNELLRLQMVEYINFVEQMVKDGNIMSKTFFVTIPFSVTQNKKEGPTGRFLKGFKGATGQKVVLRDEEFDHYRTQLFQRVEQIAIGLQGIGLRVVPLQTPELLELFYNVYNPTASRNQRLQNIGQLRIQETEE